MGIDDNTVIFEFKIPIDFEILECLKAIVANNNFSFWMSNILDRYK